MLGKIVDSKSSYNDGQLAALVNFKECAVDSFA